jgi:hypothetical protein
MKCPVCQQEMAIQRADTSYSKAKSKHYDRTLYHCAHDDTWVKMEIPKSAQQTNIVVSK